MSRLKMADLHELEPKPELSPEIQEYWELQLINAERAVAYARKMLGKLALDGEN